jgi:hypothetical protein
MLVTRELLDELVKRYGMNPQKYYGARLRSLYIE